MRVFSSGRAAKNKKQSALTLAMGGMLAALVFVATYFLKLPISATSGYIHLGDGFILMGSMLLGYLAIPAAAIGSMLADLVGGYAIYLLPTFIIKGLVALVAAFAMRSKRFWVRMAGLVLAEVVMVAGYFVVEWLPLGFGFAAALASVPGNLVQGASGVVIALALVPMVKRIKGTWVGKA